MPPRTHVIFWTAVAIAVLTLSTIVNAWPHLANTATTVVLVLAAAGFTLSIAIASRIIWVTQRQRP